MSIKKLFIIYVIMLTILPVLVISIISINSFNKRNDELVIESVTNFSIAQSKNMENFFEQRNINLNVTSKLSTVRAFLVDSNKYHKEFDNYEELKDIIVSILKTRAEAQTFIRRMSLADREGTIIASSDTHKIGDKSMFQANVNELTNGKTIVTDISSMETFLDGENYFVMVVPIYEEDVYEGFIMSVIDMSYFNEITDETKIFKNGKVIVMDKSGNIAMVGNKIVGIEDEENALAEEWEKIDIEKNASGIIKYYSNGINKIACYSRIKHIDWTVLCIADWDELSAPAKIITRRNLAFILATILIAIIICIIFFRYVSKLLHALIDRTHKIQDGDYSLRLEYNEDNELGKIIYAFNGVIDAVQKNTEELRRSEERYRIVSEQSDGIICEWDFETNVITYTKNWYKKFGYEAISQDASESFPLSSNIYFDDVDRFSQWTKKAYKGKDNSMEEFRVRKADGSYVWVRVKATAILDENDIPIRAIGVIVDIDSEKKEMEKLVFESQRDLLTGLYNKTNTQYLAEELIRESKIDKKHALIIIDIDDFKAINDSQGHMYGDEVLKYIANKINENFREYDIKGRIGGDEFMVLIKNVQSQNFIVERVDALSKALESNVTNEYGEYAISGSIGVAIYPEDGENFSELFNKADKALYKAKANGKNCFALYDDSCKAKEN